MIYTADLCDLKIDKWKSLEEAREHMGYIHPGDTFTTQTEALSYLIKCIEEDMSEHRSALEDAFGAQSTIEHYEENLPAIKAQLRALLTKKTRTKSNT